MTRATTAVPSRARRKKIVKMASGYRGRGKNCFRVAKQRVEKGLQYQYRDRRVRKREFRKLWIQRINAAARLHGMPYSQFMSGVIKAGLNLDRKVLSDLAIHEPKAFEAVAAKAKAALTA